MKQFRAEQWDKALRGLLYALMELVKNREGDEVLAHLALNAPDYYDPTRRDVIVELSGYLAQKLERLRPEEASAGRVLSELMDKYIHLRQQATDVFELRYQATIQPDANRWELCSRVLARKDIVDRLSGPW